MVCLGNICRSPLAEAALRHHAERLGLDVVVDSAGTGSWHVGCPPDERAQAMAKRLGGIDISGLRGRQLCQADFSAFDHIIAMDNANMRHMRAMMPADATARLSLMMDHLSGETGREVADPYYGDDADFAATWRQVDAAACAFAETMQRR